MRTPLLIALALPVLLVAGCNSKKAEETAPPPLTQVLPNLPLPPDAQAVNTSSGTDATQVTLRSPHPPDTVAIYYRKVLSEPPFRLVNETSADGVISFLADQDGPSLWVTIQADGATASQVTLAGALVAKSTKAGADTTRK
jgi:hypothetical protein